MKICKGIILLIILCLVAVGCSKKDKNELIRDLDFTIVQESDIPKEFLSSIEEQKSQPFKITYTTENYLYIARGYGSQKLGGYSIVVNELYLAGNGIHFKTDLIKPSNQDRVSQMIIYPYIVTRIEPIDTSVIFE